MTLSIQLSPEIESKLRARAEAAGQDLSEFVLRVVEEELSVSDPNSCGHRKKLTTQERIAELRSWAASHKKLPYEADDSRESIYEGRGE